MIEQGANSSLSKLVSLLLAQLSNAGDFSDTQTDLQIISSS